MEEENVCTLEHKSGWCKGAYQCHKCGWNQKEKNRRSAILKENGLTLCEDGLSRLILPRDPDDAETSEKEGT